MRHSLPTWCILLVCSGCSLIYNTDNLRKGIADGGPGDSAVMDSSMSDSAVMDSSVSDSAVSDSTVSDSAVSDSTVMDSGVSDSGVSDSGVSDSGAGDAGDGGCPATFPSPDSLFWDDHGRLTVTFTGTSSSDVFYELTLGARGETFILPAGAGSWVSSDPYFVPLFRTTDTLVVRASCSHDIALTQTVPTTLDFVGSSSAMLTSLGDLPSVDVDNHGTVVFSSNTALTPASGISQRLYRWRVGETPEVVVTTGTDVMTDGILSVRISDNGNVITYWQGDPRSAATTAGRYHVHWGIRDVAIGPESFFATSDVRELPATNTYAFVMTGAGDAGIATLLSDALVLSSTTSVPLSLRNAWGAARVPSLTPLASTNYRVAYAEQPGTVGDPSAPSIRSTTGGMASSVSGCSVDSSVGLVTTGSSGLVSFVGRCAVDTVDHLYVRAPDGMSSSTIDVGTANGLLASDDALDTFLVRTFDSTPPVDSFAIARLGTPPLTKPLSTDSDLASDSVTPSPTLSPLLDGAALSPNGEWAVFAPQTATSFQVVRIRVQ